MANRVLRRLTIAAASVAAIVAWSGPATADRVYLENADDPIDGRVVSEDGNRVVVEVDGGKMTLSRKQVVRIERAPWTPKPKPAAPTVAPAATGAPAAGQAPPAAPAPASGTAPAAGRPGSRTAPPPPPPPEPEPKEVELAQLTGAIADFERAWRPDAGLGTKDRPPDPVAIARARAEAAPALASAIRFAIGGAEPDEAEAALAAALGRQADEPLLVVLQMMRGLRCKGLLPVLKRTITRQDAPAALRQAAIADLSTFTRLRDGVEPDPAAVEILAGLLDDPSEGMRLSAANDLGNSGDARWIERLKRTYVEDPSMSVRLTARTALVRLGVAEGDLPQ